MFVIIALAALTAIAAPACHPGGSYAQSGRAGGGIDRGEVNGRMFDFVSNKPDGDDWQIRIRGASIWVAYAKEANSDKLGTRGLDDKQATKVWKLIDALDLTSRKPGKKDEDDGYVMLQLREPGDEHHDIYTVYVSRSTDDDDVQALATYLQDLVEKHFKERPNF